MGLRGGVRVRARARARVRLRVSVSVSVSVSASVSVRVSVSVSVSERVLNLEGLGARCAEVAGSAHFLRAENVLLLLLRIRGGRRSGRAFVRNRGWRCGGRVLSPNMCWMSSHRQVL